MWPFNRTWSQKKHRKHRASSTLLLYLLAFSVIILISRCVGILYGTGLHFKRPSLEYVITMRRSLMHDFPLVAIIGEPVYHYTGKSDIQKATRAITYLSIADKTGLYDQISNYLLSRGFKHAQSFRGKDHFIFSKLDKSVEVTLTLNENNFMEVKAMYRRGLLAQKSG